MGIVSNTSVEHWNLNLIVIGQIEICVGAVIIRPYGKERILTAEIDVQFTAVVFIIIQGMEKYSCIQRIRSNAMHHVFGVCSFLIRQRLIRDIQIMAVIGKTSSYI